MCNLLKLKIKIFIIVLLFVICKIYPDSTENINLPEKIHIKTPTQTFTVDYYFALYNGKIYYKRNQEVNNPELIYEKIRNQDPKDFNTWKLLEPNGIPFSDCKIGIPGLPNPQLPKTKKFKTPEKIIEISADNSMLIALSDKNQFYYCYLNKGSKFFRIKGWTDRWGSPKKKLFYQENFKSWQIGRRSEKVEWFEDPSGYKRSYSGYGLSTIYALHKNGRDIYFVDNGMPQTFHDIIAGPENGEFIAESMSVSGETIFLIDKYGNMYTRLADFDTIGDDVMLYKYTYKKLALPEINNGKHFYATQFGKEFMKIAVKLPPEPWRKQEAIPISDKTIITKNIAILTNGKGNAGRELRVVGTDQYGNSGYYYKNIFEKQWKFQTLNIEIKKENIINFDNSKINLGKSERKKFNGKIRFSRNLQFKAVLENFTSKYAPSTIDPSIIKLLIGTEIIEIKLYMVNTYKPIFNPIEYPYHAPRVFLGTLEIPNKISTNNKKLNNIIQRLHNRYNLKEFRFIIEAGETYVRIHQKNGSKYRFVMNFVRENTKLEKIENRAFLNPFIENKNKFLNYANNKNLIISDINNIKTSNEKQINFLKTKLEMNIKYYLELKELRKICMKNVTKVRFKAFSFRIIQGFFLITGTIIIPESMHFFKHMGMLFKIQSRQQTLLYYHTMSDFNESILILKNRINNYYNKLKQFEKDQNVINEFGFKIKKINKTIIS